MAPPAAPTGLAAARVVGRPVVSLNWDDSKDESSDGYRFYRSAESSGYGLPHAVGLSVSEFEDHTVERGNEYRYPVTAVDAAGNESYLSTQQSIMLPAGDLSFDGTIDIQGAAQLSQNWQSPIPWRPCWRWPHNGSSLITAITHRSRTNHADRY